MLENDKNIYLRTLCRSRNSLSVNLPAKLCRLLDLNHKSVVKIEADELDEIIVIKKLDIENL